MRRLPVLVQMATFQLVLLLSCVQSTFTRADSSCVEPRAELRTALALVSSLEAQLEDARQNVVAKDLQVHSCELGDVTTASQGGAGAARRTNGRVDFPCNSAEWKTHNAIVKCSSFGGKSDAIEVADTGGWTHAYREISVEPRATYTLSGQFFPLAIAECGGSAAVMWCSPSVVVCPGPYNSDYYNTGGCLVGLAPNGKDAWEPFQATFTTGVGTVTVYINQESTKFSSVVSDLNVQKLIAHSAQCYEAGSSFTDTPSCGCLGKPKSSEFYLRPTIKIVAGSWYPPRSRSTLVPTSSAWMVMLKIDLAACLCSRLAGVVDAFILKILIEEELGYPAELVPDGEDPEIPSNLVGTASVYEALERGAVHMYPEVARDLLFVVRPS